MKKPLFSIIVPIYRVEKYLDTCINSLLNQTNSDYEIILVDDGSPDNCGKICDEYAKNSNNITVIHKQNGGRLSAWIAGLENAQGEYVGSVDGDDFVDKDLIERIKSITDKYHDVEIVVYGYRSVKSEKDYGSKNIIGVSEGYYSKEQKDSIILPGLINKGSFELRSNIYLSRVNKFIKKELLLRNKKYYECKIEYGEDNLWTIPNIITANAVYVMSDFFPYNYRMNSSSITHSVNLDLWKKFNKLNSYTIEILKSLDSALLIPQVYCDSVFHAAICINSIIQSQEKFEQKRKQIRNIINDPYVEMGIDLMDRQSCSSKEKYNLFLYKHKLINLLIISKRIQIILKQYKHRLTE